jgi:nucleoside-triphosphatase THEP1
MIHVLTGPVHSGKTTFLRGMSCALKELGVDVRGFLSIAVWEKGVTLG